MPDPGPRVRPSQVSLATVFTICFGVALVAGLAFFLISAKLALTLTLGSAMAAIAMDHAVEALTRRGLRRAWAIVAVMLALTVLLVGLGLLLIPPVVSQTKALVAEVPALWHRLRETAFFESLDSRFHLEEQLRESGPAAAGAIAPVLTAIGGVVSALAALLAFLFLAVFMLIFGPELVALLLAEMTPASRQRYERIAGNIYRRVGGYLGGLLGICAINATLTTVFLVIVRMPFFLPLGILSGTSSLVPYAGPLVTGAIITVFAAITGGAWKALAVAIYFVSYGQLEGNILAPLVYRHTAHVNPLVTLVAILFLAEFMGVVGAVIAVPVAAAAQVVLQDILAMRRERSGGG